MAENKDTNSGSADDDQQQQNDQNTQQGAQDGKSSDMQNGDAKSLWDMGSQTQSDDDGSSEDDQSGKQGGEGEGEQDGPRPLVFEDRPDWLPEQFHDKDNGEVKVEAMAKAFGDLRRKMSMGDQKAPKTPEDYKIEIPDELKEAYELSIEGEDDPVVAWFRDRAHAHNMPQAVFDDLFQGYIQLARAQMGEVPSPDEEAARLGNGNKDKGVKIVQGQVTFIQGLHDKKILSDDELEEAKLLLDTAVGVSLMAKIRQWYGEDSIPIDLVTQASSGDDGASLREEQAKIEQDYSDGKISQEEYNRKMGNLEKRYEKVYGTDPAGTSAVRVA